MHLFSVAPWRNAASRPSAVLLALFCALALPAAASDYSHVCRTADGAFEIDDGMLYRAEDAGTPGKEIPYTTKGETVIRRETGYCLANEAQGRKFDYESKTYTLRIAFSADGREIETTALCELAADGLPAAYTCDKQVVVSKEGVDAGTNPVPDPAPGPDAVGAPLWLHNGSIMRLEAEGDRRRLYYEVPRKGMRKAGAKRGTLLFEGERLGDRYTGTAYIFAKGCRPIPYSVAGGVSLGEQRITMTGQAPRVGQGCRIKGYRNDVLRFDFAPYAAR